ncbi:MAG TPA: hypothetical protein VG406_06220 [Isosphaeraceae bacterium]|nr:hypothetical protein [Isosphaeraceae bacterium]
MDHPTPILDPATPLRQLVRLAIPICRLAEADRPPRRPGRPYEFAERAVAVLILVAAAERLGSKSAQDRYLAAHADELARRLGLDRFPARSTYFARYRAAAVVLGSALAVHSAHAAARRHVAARGATSRPAASPSTRR